MAKVTKKVYAFPNKATPGQPVVFNPDLCNGCNLCVNICPMDLLIPNPVRGNPPILLYPEECRYDGQCVEECPISGAIKQRHPLMMRVHWKRKETGQIGRL